MACKLSLLIAAALAPLAAVMSGCAGGQPAGSGAMEWVIDEDFSAGMDNWWVEGGESVAVEDGRLVVRADNGQIEGGNVCTVWCKTPHPADFRLELDAHVLKSSADANNINLCRVFSDPDGRPLFDTRADRSSSAYRLYHGLRGNIVTFLNDRLAEGGRHGDGSTKARVRIRHCPGFQLLKETFTGHCRQGETYHIAVTRRGGEIAFEVDGREMLRATDPDPPGPGLLGLRTFGTELWWDNVRLRGLE